MLYLFASFAQSDFLLTEHLTDTVFKGDVSSAREDKKATGAQSKLTISPLGAKLSSPVPNLLQGIKG